MSEEIKQVIIIRSDLKMGKGKMVAQGSHASVYAALQARNIKSAWFDKWLKTGSKKIVVKVQSEKELFEIYQDAKDMGLPVAIINDAGHTQLAPGTTTAVAIGPAPSTQLDQFTGELKLL